VNRELVDLDEIGSVFLRPYDIREVMREPPAAISDAAVDRPAAIQQHLFAWTDIADALVVNRPSAIVSNASKPYQAELIRRSGFEIPPTLVTTTPDTAREFVARHGRVIYKSVSGARSTVSRLAASEWERLDEVVHCPTQFQAYIEGADWRVHVVGDAVYACEIQCAADDYRCADQQGVSIDIRSAELPEPIAMRCRSLAQSLKLPLAGIDLRRTDDDTWCCFEVNPAPAFTYYEQATGQPLSGAVARLLSAHVNPCYGLLA
jgi:glutathione synthase/RimK-type ligase-like ATP-grasp enzyme